MPQRKPCRTTLEPLFSATTHYTARKTKLHAHTYTITNTHMHNYKHTHTQIQTHIHTITHTHIHNYTHTHTQLQTHIYTQLHTHIYTITHTMISFIVFQLGCFFIHKRTLHNMCGYFCFCFQIKHYQQNLKMCNLILC